MRAKADARVHEIRIPAPRGSIAVKPMARCIERLCSAATLELPDDALIVGRGGRRIRELAARMAGAGGKRIVVQAKSAETVAYVLRAYADIISRPGVDDVGPFRVDVWDEGGIIETLARCSNLLVARAAFDQPSKNGFATR